MFRKINDAYESIKNGLEAEIALATAEQKEGLADAKLALADLKEYIADLREENRSLKEKLILKKRYTLENSVYWLESDKKREQPYCPACYAEGKISPMEPDHRNTRETVFRCPSDKKHVSNPFDYHWTPLVPRVGGNNWPRSF